MLVGLLSQATLPVALAPAQEASPILRSLAHQLDWQHPVHVHPGRSGIGSARSGEQVSTTTPNANFPGGCLNGVAYNVIVQGRTVWTVTTGPLTASVQYQWCPRFARDSVGLNWAYGRTTVSGCAAISVGDLNDPFHNPHRSPAPQSGRCGLG